MPRIPDDGPDLRPSSDEVFESAPRSGSRRLRGPVKTIGEWSAILTWFRMSHLSLY